MKSKKIQLVIILISLMLGHQYLYAQTAQELLPQAIQLEEVKGELNEAIKVYQSIVDQYPDNGNVCAEALLRMGNCYEKLGKTEAIKSYEMILEKYSGQLQQVEAARIRLAALKKEEPEGLIVENLEWNIGELHSLSPDGTKIVGLDFGKGQNIVVSYLDEDKIDFITNYEWGDGGSYWAYHPVWSPDGKEIAYTEDYDSNKEGAEENKMCISDLNGNFRIVTKSEKGWYIPNAWMPDGSSIVTIKSNEDGTQELGLVYTETGQYEKLISLKGLGQTYGHSLPSASVSPDGKYIVYVDQVSNDEGDLFIVSSDGKSSWNLTDHPAQERTPRWSPDGRYIIFPSNRHGGWALWGVAVEDGKADGDFFMIKDGMGNRIGNWTVHGLLAGKVISIRDVFLMDVDPETGEPAGIARQLKYTPTGSNFLPKFAPKGNKLAFISTNRVSGKFHLVIEENNGQIVKEYELPDGVDPLWILCIRWMPNGEGIGLSYVNMVEENYLLRFTFAAERWDQIPIPNPAIRAGFDWSRKPNTIILSKNDLPEDAAGIIEYNLDTGEEHYVYRSENPEGAIFRNILCSKDYKNISFGEFGRGSVVVNLESGESRLLGGEINALRLSWSPEGEKLIMIFTDNQGNGRKSLIVKPISEGETKNFDLSKVIPENGNIFSYCDWSADGSQIAFIMAQSQSELLLYKNIIPLSKQ